MRGYRGRKFKMRYKERGKEETYMYKMTCRMEER